MSQNPCQCMPALESCLVSMGCTSLPFSGFIDVSCASMRCDGTCGTIMPSYDGLNTTFPSPTDFFFFFRLFPFLRTKLLSRRRRARPLTKASARPSSPLAWCAMAGRHRVFATRRSSHASSTSDAPTRARFCRRSPRRASRSAAASLRRTRVPSTLRLVPSCLSPFWFFQSPRAWGRDSPATTARTTTSLINLMHRSTAPPLSISHAPYCQVPFVRSP